MWWSRLPQRPTAIKSEHPELYQKYNKDVSANNEGYDIKSVSPEELKRYIEVKKAVVRLTEV